MDDSRRRHDLPVRTLVDGAIPMAAMTQRAIRRRLRVQRTLLTTRLLRP
jgi:hypothetical protein